ncbi:hypothetical protein [Jiella pelagia]|uniref:Tail fiber protein n=1 Tax=Jiella pelagia TaxID=2986949 RepID=A0ABY7BYU7_9HYPH|nr:hypothetical protein [Jiella pelagia]WAP69031.1 hypothetical protein OH818_01455 [Jiella pelagia]
MHKIDTLNATAENNFQNGTIVSPDWFNAVQNEIASVIEGAGISLVKEDNGQLLEAIGEIIASSPLSDGSVTLAKQADGTANKLQGWGADGSPTQVEPGTSLTVTGGTLNADLATTGSPGVVQIGSGLSVDGGGVVSAPGVAKAHVNFDGRSGSVAIRGGYNVSSVVRNGAGDYTINFTNALPNTNFTVIVTGSNPAGGGASNGFIASEFLLTGSSFSRTTTSCRVGTYNGSQAYNDAFSVNVIVM